MIKGAGFVTEWWHLVIIRALLGALESSLFAAVILLYSCWYTRYDVHKRFSLGYSISTLLAALAPLMATGFMQMKGLHNLAGWRWIFIMEGMVTFAIAIIGWILIVDYPLGSHRYWRFLTENEEAYVIRCINRDRADATDTPRFELVEFLKPAKDWKAFTYPLMFL